MKDFMTNENTMNKPFTHAQTNPLSCAVWEYSFLGNFQPILPQTCKESQVYILVRFDSPSDYQEPVHA